jgi:CPA2 family monovalent cation:H+ antiporter-2
MGLSLALGAFVAGMMLGETEFRHQIEAEIRPFRDVLMGLFFITIGMLFNIHLLPEVWTWVLLLLSALVFFKLLLVSGLCYLVGWDSGVAIRTGLVLAHGGEFGFAILILALSGNLYPPDYGQVILTSLMISMGLAPLLIRFNGPLVSMILTKASTTNQQIVKGKASETTHELRDHVIICGYGRGGRKVARFLRDEDISFISLDLDPILVQNAVKAKENIIYGDASNLNLLKGAGLSRAAALVFCIDDVPATLKILPQVRQINKKIHILVRTHDDSQLDQLQKAGATEVFPEIMEASLMLSSHLLLLLKVPIARVFFKSRQARNERYSLLRKYFPDE